MPEDQQWTGSFLYWRTRGGARRAYGDFRKVGGGREALIPAGATVATDDEQIAQALITARLRELQEHKRNATLLGVHSAESFANYVARHLKHKAETEDVSTAWLEATERYLKTATTFFDKLRTAAGARELGVDPALVNPLGADRDLTTIRTAHMKAYARYLASLPSARPKRPGAKIGAGTQRHHLNAVSNLFEDAIGDELYSMANPVHALRNKPKARVEEARWLEVWEAALILESARTYPYDAPIENRGDRLLQAIGSSFGPGVVGMQEFARRMRPLGRYATAPEQLAAYAAGTKHPSTPFVRDAAKVLGVEASWLQRGEGITGPAAPHAIMYPLIATWLLTGGREDEVCGLEVDDVSFRRGVVTFRENDWRTLKNDGSRRAVPLWPQLRDILEAYLETHDEKHSLLFPSPRLLAREGREGLITDSRKALDAIAGRVGWAPGEIRTRIFRHTYIATRIQTLDGGQPVAIYTVARQAGHKSTQMIQERYGHLQNRRLRSDAVEYRVDQHEEVAEMVQRLRPLRIA